MTRRTERINDLLREEISDILRREIKDPRIGGLLSVTEVDVSPDLRQAKVYISVMAGEEETTATFKALRSAAGFVQRSLRGRLTLRRTPGLTFFPDDSISQGARILTLLEQANESPEQPQP